MIYTNLKTIGGLSQRQKWNAMIRRHVDSDRKKFQKELSEVEDLMDFYEAWPQLRDDASKITRNRVLEPEELEIINWLIKLADRITRLDLE